LRWTFNYDDDTVEMSEGTLILLFFCYFISGESGLLELYAQYTFFSKTSLSKWIYDENNQKRLKNSRKGEFSGMSLPTPAENRLRFNELLLLPLFSYIRTTATRRTCYTTTNNQEMCVGCTHTHITLVFFLFHVFNSSLLLEYH
jgi:hypothetical protein